MYLIVKLFVRFLLDLSHLIRHLDVIRFDLKLVFESDVAQHVRLLECLFVLDCTAVEESEEARVAHHCGLQNLHAHSNDEQADELDTDDEDGEEDTIHRASGPSEGFILARLVEQSKVDNDDLHCDRC